MPGLAGESVAVEPQWHWLAGAGKEDMLNNELNNGM